MPQVLNLAWYSQLHISEQSLSGFSHNWYPSNTYDTLRQLKHTQKDSPVQMHH